MFCDSFKDFKAFLLIGCRSCPTETVPEPEGDAVFTGRLRMTVEV
jgi:hypothetical protein